MKKLMKINCLNVITVVCLSLIFNYSLANDSNNNWAPIGAKWCYSLPSINPQGDFISFTSEKDTLVGGKLSKKIIKQNSQGNILNFKIMYEKNNRNNTNNN